jgi:branched-chain amino acid transport system substrate-binding protein
MRSIRAKRGGARCIAALSVLALLTAAACSDRGDDDDSGGGGGGGGGGDEAALSADNCPEDSDPTQAIEGDTITLASSYPQSGNTAAFAEIAKGWQAYFAMVNEAGGVQIGDQQYQIEWVDADDQYDPERTARNVEELVGEDGTGAFATFSVVGTTNNLSIRDFLGDLCVPNLFAATGSPFWGDTNYPWTLGSTLPPYTVEAQAFVDLLAAEKPDAQVAMLVQDDEYGRAYEDGVRNAVDASNEENDTTIEVVAVENYEPGFDTDPTTQVTTLANSGADVFFNGATLLTCPTALNNAAGWEREITWVSGTCISKTLMGIAGENAAGVYSASNIKDPQSPDWADDEAMTEYRDALAQYEPEADPGNGIVAYGWTQGAALVQALEQAEEPTRLAVMESVRNLELGDDVGLLLPDTGATTGPDDAYLGELVYRATYSWQGSPDDSYFELDGDVQDFEGRTADITPPDLISRED